MLNAAALLAAHVPVDVRTGDPARDAIDDVVPGLVIEPHTVPAVAATLAWASEGRLSVLLRGAGTKRQWGRPPDRLDVILDMGRLNRIVAHSRGDLTVTVEAGVSLKQLNGTLAPEGQQLPLDPPDDRATVGGLLATDDSGPARHRFGTPRDLVIGIQLATADGLLAKAGGQVVKNVAGYDLSKLMSGSFGALAAIVSATFKLSPLPAASSTLLVNARTWDVLEQIVTTVASTQLEPVAFEISLERGSPGAPSNLCLLRFASRATSVDAQVADALARLGAIGAPVELLTGEAEARRWRAHSIGGAHTAEDAVLRVNWLPADLAGVATEVDALATMGPLAMIGRAGIGAGLIRIGGDVKRQVAAIEQLRQSSTLGNVIVVHGSTALKAHVDVWGEAQNARLIQAVKHALDPNGVLGAGRGPIGRLSA